MSEFDIVFLFLFLIYYIRFFEICRLYLYYTIPKAHITAESIYAYVTNAADTGVFEKQYKLKLFCQDNEWKELYLKDKVTWNGTKNVKGENVVENTLKSADGTVVPQLIECSLNANDEIFKINIDVDRAAAPDLTDLLCLDASGEERYKNVNKSLGSQHFVSQSKFL